MVVYFYFNYLFNRVGNSLDSVLDKFFSDDCSPDGEDMLSYSAISITKGFIWPITIWVAISLWVSSGETPYWAEILVKLYKFIIRRK